MGCLRPATGLDRVTKEAEEYVHEKLGSLEHSALFPKWIDKWLTTSRRMSATWATHNFQCVKDWKDTVSWIKKGLDNKSWGNHSERHMSLPNVIHGSLPCTWALLPLPNRRTPEQKCWRWRTGGRVSGVQDGWDCFEYPQAKRYGSMTRTPLVLTGNYRAGVPLEDDHEG